MGWTPPPETRHKYAKVELSIPLLTPHAQIDGVVVQPMAGAGVELIVGSKLDPVFGPLIVVGLGGIFVELMKDVCVRIAPVSVEEATGMLRSLRGAKVFEGFRGMEAVDLSSVAGVVARVSELAVEWANEDEEIDVPLICTGERVIAADALVTCHRA
ncbi:acetate--CoA ligase family protein [Achromobacter aegrifaciens]